MVTATWPTSSRRTNATVGNFNPESPEYFGVNFRGQPSIGLDVTEITQYSKQSGAQCAA